MFTMAVLGNIFYACGVLMEGSSANFILNHLPWLIGSIGTLVFDFTIMVQYCTFGAEVGSAAAQAAHQREITQTSSYEDDDEALLP